jgi:hypothetical protein
MLTVNSVRQSEGTAEGAVGSLDAMVALLLLLILELTLTLDRERTVLEPYLNVFLLHAWKIDSECQVILGFDDVNRRRPWAIAGVGRRPAERFLEEAQAAWEVFQLVPKISVFHECHGFVPR